MQAEGEGTFARTSEEFDQPSLRQASAEGDVELGQTGGSAWLVVELGGFEQGGNSGGSGTNKSLMPSSPLAQRSA